MKCFIKKVFEGDIDEETHRQFVRFGKGNYEGRAIIKLHKTSKIKLSASSEYANDFVNFVAENTQASFSGIVLSRKDIPELKGKMKAGIHHYDFKGDSEKVKQIANQAHVFLLDAEGQGIILKMKKKLPKPGKSGEGKIDDKFCKIEADLKYFEKLKQTFFWDAPSDCKKAQAVHQYIINEIIEPAGEQDFEQIRLKSKRKGKIIRKLIVDKKEKREEKEMVV